MASRNSRLKLKAAIGYLSLTLQLSAPIIQARRNSVRVGGGARPDKQPRLQAWLIHGTYMAPDTVTMTLTKMYEEGSAFPERSWTMESDRRPSRSLVIWSSVPNR